MFFRQNSGEVASLFQGQHKDRQRWMLTLISLVSLEYPFNLIFKSLDSGRKPEHPEKTHTGTKRTSKLHKERLRSRFKRGILFAVATATLLPVVNVICRTLEIIYHTV